MNIRRISKVLVLMIMLVLVLNIDNAIEIKTNSSVNPGNTFTVTVDFGVYVDAYDSYKVTYNTQLLELVSGDVLEEKLWWNTSENEKGIKTRTYTFRAKENGKADIKVEAIGVSRIEQLSNGKESIVEVGDINTTKTVTIGDGVYRGDVNGDGVVNVEDAAYALDIYKGTITPNEIQKKAADLDSNGMINVQDAGKILDKYKGL